MNLSIEQINTFVTVYEQQSFSRAAVKLEKHRSTIGQLIVNLEDILNISLFNRIGRVVEPTEEAKVLYRYAKQASEQVKTINRLSMSLSEGTLECINFGYCSFLPQIVIVDIRMQLERDFPNLRVNFFSQERDEVKSGIQSGELHFGLVNIHESRAMNSFHTTYLDTLSLIPFTGKNNKLAKIPSDEVFAHLKAEKQIVLKSLVSEGLGEKVILSPNYEVIDQLSLIVEMLHLGYGWSLLPRSVIRSEFVKKNLVPIEVDEMRKSLEIPISLWCPHSLQLAKIRTSILTAIQNYIDFVNSEYN